MKNYKKLDVDSLESENFGLKEYFKTLNLPDARRKFALGSKMTRSIQMNYKGDKKFKANQWKCVECGEDDTQEHLLQCKGYKYLREGKNLEDDYQLVDYFRKNYQCKSKA